MPGIFTYFKFLLKSSSAHGVHSPFVYDLVSLCLRKKRKTAPIYKELTKPFPKVFRPKHIRILNDIISYLEVKGYAHLCKSEHSIDKLPITKLLPKVTNSIADFIYTPQENFNHHHANQLLKELKTNAVLVIENPYNNIAVWENLKKNPKAHVIVDTYFFGLVFNRKQQAKEHFYIRLKELF